MFYDKIDGVPNFECREYKAKKNKYCLCIPIINEGERILTQLKRAKINNINDFVDIIICDGNSKDGSTEDKLLKDLNVNTLLIKQGDGKQGAQLRMGLWWCINRGYEGIITIDGNNKDSIEDIPLFIDKLNEGYDFIQGSRFIKGGKAINTPIIRLLAVKLIHVPIISITAKYKFTDTTNGYRGYSKKYIIHEGVKPFRDIFITYELLAYLSVRASQLKMNVCEIPVERKYPSEGKVPTKINHIRGNFELIKILIKNLFRKYNPKKER